MSEVLTPPFQFTTKAGNLAQLRGRLATAQTLALEVLKVGEWRADPVGSTERLQAVFGGHSLIVRSSAPGEDSVESSMAGAFDSVLDVDGGDSESIRSAIDEVVEGYSSRRGEEIDCYEILIQPMLENVSASGVVFTRDLDKGGPYYLLNYDDVSGRTDTITAGESVAHKIIKVFRGVNTEELDGIEEAVVRTARELEEVTGTEVLDIEFAVDDLGVLYVLQVRPLARTRIFSPQRLDRRIGDEIRHAREFLSTKMKRVPGLFGETTVFGEMPDWNPAEIIGTSPKPLASSLYAYIIMREVWREARELCGYRNPKHHQLLVNIAGRPYVDVRSSFNSFLPATLRPELCEKLVDHYLARLREHPEYHDKIEFEIVISVLDFDFEKDRQNLISAGCTDGEIAEIREALLSLTDSLVNDQDGTLVNLECDVKRLRTRRAELLSRRRTAREIPLLVEQLLNDCIRCGTLPFAVFARCAFIGNSFLKSLVRQEVLTDVQLEDFHAAISTVTGHFVDELERCKSGGLSVQEFLSRYGHLRPGTYDICAPCYSEKPEIYLGMECASPPVMDSPIAVDEEGGEQVCFPESCEAEIERLIAACGFTFSVSRLEQFVVRAIQLREAVKFEFTKNLSAALSLLAEFGVYHGISRECMAFVPIEKVLTLANESFSADWLLETRETIDRNRKRYELTGAINLPDLIFSPSDLEVISLQRRRPNFVTQGRVVGPSIQLRGSEETEHVDVLAGRIVLIENADPGFDWLFAHGIGGLVTKYGGAASHMTIRCAELGIPAAIGCGERIFSELSNAGSIILDCGGKRVESNEA